MKFLDKSHNECNPTRPPCKVLILKGEFRRWIWHIIYQSVFSQRRLLLARNHPQHLELADHSNFILQNGYNRLVNHHVLVFGDYLLLKKKKKHGADSPSTGSDICEADSSLHWFVCPNHSECGMQPFFKAITIYSTVLRYVIIIRTNTIS